jgi:short-subunit dehydrogenase
MKIAVITGASSGLGAEYCRLLQACGEYDEIWLIARRLERLQALKGDDARMRCLSLDLTDAAAFDALCKELTAHNAEIALLINNAGLGTYGSLETLSAESQVRMTDLNVTALTRMTAIRSCGVDDHPIGNPLTLHQHPQHRLRRRRTTNISQTDKKYPRYLLRFHTITILIG